MRTEKKEIGRLLGLRLYAPHIIITQNQVVFYEDPQPVLFGLLFSFLPCNYPRCGGLYARNGREEVLLPVRKLRGVGAGAWETLSGDVDWPAPSAWCGVRGGGPGE